MPARALCASPPLVPLLINLLSFSDTSYPHSPQYLLGNVLCIRSDARTLHCLSLLCLRTLRLFSWLVIHLLHNRGACKLYSSRSLRPYLTALAHRTPYTLTLWHASCPNWLQQTRLHQWLSCPLHRIPFLGTDSFVRSRFTEGSMFG